MSDLCKCGHTKAEHQAGTMNCILSGEACDCRTFRGRPAGKSQGAASAGEPPTVRSALTAPADRDDLAAIVADEIMNMPYAHRDTVDPLAGRVAQMVLESDWLRGVRAKELRDAAAVEGDPIARVARVWLLNRADRVDAEDGGR